MDIKRLQDIPPWEWPRDAGKLFQKALTDRRASESDRLAAADLAGNLIVMNDSIAATLLSIVGRTDESAKLRAKAAISLGPVLELAYTDEFDDPEEVPISEETFRKVQDTLEKLYRDESIPKEVRRRILEASVRAPEDWHREAIQAAYSSGDRDWMLTAVFAMCWVRGFDEQILEALNSKDPDIHFEAVEAAGTWQVEAAWPHVTGLIDHPDTPKRLLLSAIAAVASIRPAEAGPLLVDLADSADEDIAEAVDEALAMAEFGDDDEEEDDEDEEGADKWIN